MNTQVVLVSVLIVAIQVIAANLVGCASIPEKDPCKIKCEEMGYFYEPSGDDICSCTNKLEGLGSFKP